MARDGAAALSLRSIARDLGMAPSALYRYFDGRDALLSALILAAYEALAAEAERAADEAEAGAGAGRRRTATPSAGCPCPAPCGAGPWSTRTSGGSSSAPRSRATRPRGHGRALRPDGGGPGAPAGGGARGGRLRTDDRTRPVSDELRAAVAPVTEGLLPGMPVEKVVLALEAWTTIVGAISLEVFGHWRNTVLEPELLFEATIAQAAEAIGLQ